MVNSGACCLSFGGYYSFDFLKVFYFFDFYYYNYNHLLLRSAAFQGKIFLPQEPIKKKHVVICSRRESQQSFWLSTH